MRKLLLLGAAVLMIGATASTASARTQPFTIQVVNQSGIPAVIVQRAMRATMTEANGEFRHVWLAGRRLRLTISPTAGAWKVFVQRNIAPECGKPPAGLMGGISGCHWCPPSQSPCTPVAWIVSDDALDPDLSHEVLEMLVDPTVDRYGPNGDLVEVCDPVNNVTVWRYGYGVPNGMSDWVYPRWFGYPSRAHATGSERFDFAGVVQHAGSTFWGDSPQ